MSLSSVPFVALSTALVGSIVGCAGARFDVTAANSRYPVSMSDAVRDSSGLLYEPRYLRKVATFSDSHTAIGILYSILSLPITHDISDEVNTQVQAAGGEAVTGLNVSLSTSCNTLNLFPLLNALPIWPGCSSVTITGDIVRRRGPPPQRQPHPITRAAPARERFAVSGS